MSSPANESYSISDKQAEKESANQSDVGASKGSQSKLKLDEQQNRSPSNNRDNDEAWKEVKSKKNKSRVKQSVGENADSSTRTAKTSTATIPDELEFQFDEDLDADQHQFYTSGRKNHFTSWSDDDSDYEISDNEVAKLIIVTQSLSSSRIKHEGYDRTGDWTTRVKITQELGKEISDGLFYYEQDLWSKWGVNEKQDPRQHKTVGLISQEAFEKFAPKSSTRAKRHVPPPPPPPPPTFEEESYIVNKEEAGIFKHHLICKYLSSNNLLSTK